VQWPIFTAVAPSAWHRRFLCRYLGSKVNS